MCKALRANSSQLEHAGEVLEDVGAVLAPEVQDDDVVRQIHVAQIPQLRHEVVLLIVGVAEGEGERAEVVLAHALALEVDLHAVEDEDGVVDIGREDLFEVVLDTLGAF